MKVLVFVVLFFASIFPVQAAEQVCSMILKKSITHGPITFVSEMPNGKSAQDKIGVTPLFKGESCEQWSKRIETSVNIDTSQIDEHVCPVSLGYKTIAVHCGDRIALRNGLSGDVACVDSHVSVRDGWYGCKLSTRK